MAMPAASAAATTSASFIEPPGWITAVTPARAPNSRPSGNGKNASEAMTAPRVRSAARCTASWTASTRDIWPAPTPTAAPSLNSTIALDFTCLTAVHANPSCSHSASVDVPVGRHHPTERRHLVALVGHAVGGGGVAGDRESARVHVLDDRHGRLRVVHRELERGGCVLDVVEPQGTTLHLIRAANPTRVGTEPVERRLLVLVLAVLQGLVEQPRDRDLGRKTIGLVPPHVSGDPGVVGRRMPVRLRRQAAPR